MPPYNNLPIADVIEVVNKLMAEESASKISRPMHPDCRAAVLVPVYDENPETVLRPLLSLSKQEGVRPEEFEILVLVNNSREEAAAGSASFQKNQDMLRMLGQLSEREKPAAGPHRAELQAIKDSGIIVHALDKSGLETSESGFHVGRARNRGCLELVSRFLSTPVKLEGVIAMLDADCRVSAGYIRVLADFYGRYDFLNGLAGAVDHEIDSSVPHAESVYKAFLAHLDYERPLPGNFKDRLILQNRHKVGKTLLFSGANMTMRARSWLQAGAFPNRPSGEDFLFGFALAGLPGDVGLTDRYTVSQLMRISKRTGFGSYGRRVQAIAQAVIDFKEGRRQRLLVPDLHKDLKLVNRLLQAAETGNLKKDEVLALLRSFGCDVNGLDTAELVDSLNAAMRRPERLRDYVYIDELLLNKLYDRMPRRDVTGLVI